MGGLLPKDDKQLDASHLAVSQKGGMSRGQRDTRGAW